MRSIYEKMSVGHPPPPIICANCSDPLLIKIGGDAKNVIVVIHTRGGEGLWVNTVDPEAFV